MERKFFFRACQIIESLQRNETTRKSTEVEILALTEVRWRNSGSKSLAEGYQFIYSGQARAAANYSGVGMLIHPRHKNALMSWSPISDRIMTARFKTKLRNITFIIGYGPTNVAEPEKKDRFYDHLNATIAKAPRSDIVILLGDFNAQVADPNRCQPNIMGSHGLHLNPNDNGNRLIDICAQHQLFIGGTKFPHKKCHKYTWSPRGRPQVQTQIDHIIISRKFLNSLLDVRTKRSAVIDSDHELLMGKLRLKFAKIRKTK